MAPRVTKSLGRYIFNALNATPLTSALIPFVPANWVLGDNIQHTTVANLLSGGGGALDIGLRLSSQKVLNADVITLPTIDVTLVAGIANTILLPVVAFLHLNWVADYNAINAAAVLNICWDSAVGGGFNCMSQLVETTAGEISQLFAAGKSATGTVASSLLGVTGVTFTDIDGQVFSEPGVVGKPITCAVNNAAPVNFGAGNVGNSLQISLLYIAIPILP